MCKISPARGRPLESCSEPILVFSAGLEKKFALELYPRRIKCLLPPGDWLHVLWFRGCFRVFLRGSCCQLLRRTIFVAPEKGSSCHCHRRQLPASRFLVQRRVAAICIAIETYAIQIDCRLLTPLAL